MTVAWTVNDWLPMLESKENGPKSATMERIAIRLNHLIPYKKKNKDNPI